MDTPEPSLPLCGPARAFWDRHYADLTDRRVMTEADRDSFALLCVTWGKVAALSLVAPSADNFREMIQLTNLAKQYQSLAKQFGLLPRDRRQAKMDDDSPAAEDEFGL